MFLGPLEHTAHDFWQMIWEQQTLVIVMLARVIEKNSNKCFQYWGLLVGDKLTFGHFTVKTTKVFNEGDFILTKIELSYAKVSYTLYFTTKHIFNYSDFKIRRMRGV